MKVVVLVYLHDTIVISMKKKGLQEGNRETVYMNINGNYKFILKCMLRKIQEELKIVCNVHNLMASTPRLNSLEFYLIYLLV